jgi:hypothetical protein
MAVHSLASHRAYTHWFTLAGQHETPTSFAMRTRMLDCVKFDDNPSIIGAANGLRFGRHGVSIMHFGRVDPVAQLAAGSTGANIHLDFGTSAAPPPPPACTSYFDLLSAIQGLLTFAHAEWFEEFTRPLHRLREFTVANMDADPLHNPERVQRTLHEVNHHLGATYVHLASDSPLWWREFSTAAARIEFRSVAWSMALQELQQPAAPRSTPSASAPCFSPGPLRTAARSRYAPRHDDERNTAARPSGIPASVRALIPRDAHGMEPCLRFFGGGMCYGGQGSEFTHCY